MRDLVVREGLEAMARDAAKLFRELIASGEEIPYRVREPGDGSPLCRYEPLTELFVRDHAGALRELDSFGAACAALESSDLAAVYLADMGIAAPPAARPRAELAAVVFLCRLWGDSSDFSLDGERLRSAVEELEEGSDAAVDEIEVVVPLRGLSLPVGRLELATATIIRADTVEVPSEARAGDAAGASPWEPTFLAVARTALPDDAAEEDAAEAGLRGTDAFRRLVTTLRLFKAGGVGLGPYAWVRAGSNRWRRIATGAGKPRPGGYRLAEAELGELIALSRTLASPSSPLGRVDAGRPGLAAGLGRAISRFEAGLERLVVLEALNDNLLALRFVLEGGGPADLGLPMRVAALCAGPDRRAEVKAVLDRAVALERVLWSGEPHGPGPVPAETATQLEELTRAILKDAACGHLGADLRSTADEILLADGLAVGEGAAGQRGATEEWDPAEEPGLEELEEPGAEELDLEPEADRLEEGLPDAPAEDEEVDAHPWSVQRGGDPLPELEPRIEVMKVSAEPDRIIGEPSEPAQEEQMTFRAHAAQPAVDEPPTTVIDAVDDRRENSELDVDRIPPGSPVLRLIEQTRSEREARADRLANLFPRPETCEWDVREIGYDRRRRAEAG
jgi:hypothetical protein